MVEKFVLIRILKTALEPFRDGCPESGENDNIVRLLLEDVFRSSLDESGHNAL